MFTCGFKGRQCGRFSNFCFGPVRYWESVRGKKGITYCGYDELDKEVDHGVCNCAITWDYGEVMGGWE